MSFFGKIRTCKSNPSSMLSPYWYEYTDIQKAEYQTQLQSATHGLDDGTPFSLTASDTPATTAVTMIRCMFL